MSKWLTNEGEPLTVGHLRALLEGFDDSDPLLIDPPQSDIGAPLWSVWAAARWENEGERGPLLCIAESWEDWRRLGRVASKELEQGGE